MQEMRIDGFDIAILDALQRNANLTNAELAEIVNLSASQCSRRRSTLEKAGIIKGYGARLSAEKLGFTLQAMVRVNLASHGKEHAEDFSRYLEGYREVLAAYSVSGDADYILHVHTRDLESFASFIHMHLLPYPKVGQVRSDIILTVLKEPSGLPLR
jgi:DNA-binding Lrp family transcriptional regulator